MGCVRAPDGTVDAGTEGTWRASAAPGAQSAKPTRPSVWRNFFCGRDSGVSSRYALALRGQETRGSSDLHRADQALDELARTPCSEVNMIKRLSLEHQASSAQGGRRRASSFDLVRQHFAALLGTGSSKALVHSRMAGVDEAEASGSGTLPAVHKPLSSKSACTVVQPSSVAADARAALQQEEAGATGRKGLWAQCKAPASSIALSYSGSSELAAGTGTDSSCNNPTSMGSPPCASTAPTTPVGFSPMASGSIVCSMTAPIPCTRSQSCCAPAKVHTPSMLASPDSTAAPPTPFTPLTNGDRASCEDGDSSSRSSGTARAVLPDAPHLLAVCKQAPPAMVEGRPAWRITDYDVTRRICKSSTSQVFKATCLYSGLPVALKVYFLNKVPQNVLHMLHREVQVQVELAHRNVVMLYGAFQDDKHLVLVQEYAANGNLNRLHLELGCRMSEQQARLLVLQPLLHACASMHTQGVIHRDIKPDNILFAGGHRLVLADFGVAINVRSERAVTRAGTEGFMAPEVRSCPIKDRPDENKERRDLAYSTAVDVWSVGTLAYWLLVGRLPVFHVHQHDGDEGDVGPQSVLLFPPTVTPGARNFIASALAQHPEDRPTALQLLHDSWLCGSTW